MSLDDVLREWLGDLPDRPTDTGYDLVYRREYHEFTELVRSTGLPYRDIAVGGFGALHMYLIDKPLEISQAQTQRPQRATGPALFTGDCSAYGA